jgi:hypothetical protein
LGEAGRLERILPRLEVERVVFRIARLGGKG